MKQLLIVRHAKSDWNHPGLDDHDRPLNRRGHRDAPEMGRRIAELTGRPDRILCSSALRARTTAATIAAVVGYPEGALLIEPALYGAGSTDIIERLRDLTEELETVMVVAHNPTLTSLANRLSGSTIDNIPTCGVVTLSLNSDSWKGIGEGGCELLDFDYPKRGH